MKDSERRKLNEELRSIRVHKSIKSITNITMEDIRKMTKGELLWIANYATSVANKRRERALGALTPDDPIPRAYQDWRSKKYQHKTASGEKATSFRDVDFTMSPDMSFWELRSKFVLINKFLKTTTSTITGQEKFMRKFRRGLRGAIAKERGIPIEDVKLRRLNQEETNMLWKAYNRVIEANPTIMNTYASTQVQAMIYQEVTQKEGKQYVYDVDDLVSHAMKYAMEIKERSDDGKSTTPLGLVGSGKDVSVGQNKRNSKKNR